MAKNNNEPKREAKVSFLVPDDYIVSQTAANGVVAAMNEVPYTKSMIARPYAVTHVQYDGSRVYDTGNLNIFDVDQIKRLISKYWTENFGGQVPSAATLNAYATAFIQYALTAERVVARFLQFRRVQNSFNLENDLMGKIGRVLNDPADMGLGDWETFIRNNQTINVAEVVTNGKLQGTGSVYGNFAANGISNAAWKKDYVAQLENVFLPPVVLSCLKTLFTGVFELSSDDDETQRYVCFWQPAANGQFPGGAEGSIANFKNAFDTDIATLEALTGQYATLQPILEKMEWVKVRGNVPDDRDLEGKTLEIIRDKDNQFETIFKTVLLSQVDVQNNTDLVGNSIVQVTTENYLPHILKSPARNIDMTALYNLGQFLRCKVTSLCVGYVEILKYGGATTFTINTSFTCGDNVEIYNSDDGGVARRIQAALDVVDEMDALVGGPLHRIETAGPLSTVNITIYDSLLESSAKTFIIPEGDVVSLIFCVNNAFFIKTLDKGTPSNSQH